MRDWVVGDVIPYLKGKKYGSNLDLLADVCKVISGMHNEEKNHETKKPSSSSTTSSSSPDLVPSCKRQRLRDQKKLKKPITDLVSGRQKNEDLLGKPMKEKYQCCSQTTKLLFKFDGNLILSKEIPSTSSGSIVLNKKQKASWSSGCVSLNKKRKADSSLSSGSIGSKKRAKASSGSVPNMPKVLSYQGPPPPLPQRFRDLILGMGEGREASEPILVCMKPLYASDISKSHNRFMIPKSQMKPFLSSNEISFLNSSKMEGVVIIEPNLNVGTVTVVKWKMNADIISLIGSWSHIVSRNNLGLGMIMQLWACRINHELILVLVKVGDRIPNPV